MSYRRSYYHFVFRTKHSEKLLTAENSSKLYSYIIGISNELGYRVIRINGMSDHIHIAAGLPDVLPNTYIREVKCRSSRWMKDNPSLFRRFKGWAKGYFGSSFSHKDLDKVANYIANQQEHHIDKTFSCKMERFFSDAGMSDKTEGRNEKDAQQPKMTVEERKQRMEELMKKLG